MSRLSNGALTPEQLTLISQLAGYLDPKKPEDVRSAVKAFRDQFNLDMPWAKMRLILTKIRRRDRRNGTQQKGGKAAAPQRFVNRTPSAFMASRA